jgi:two-component sensor histidine kinase
MSANDSKTDYLPEIFNRSFDGIIIFQPLKNSNGEIIDFIYKDLNDTTLKFLPGTREDYMGKRYLECFPKAFETGIFDLYKSVAVSGISTEQDFFYGDEKIINSWFKNSVFKSSAGDDIVVFFRDVSEIKNLEISLKKSLDEKEMLLREIHHRVKNSLQIIASILNIQSTYSNDPDVYRLFLDSQNRIKAVALIHEKLYEVHQSFLTINLDEYIKDLVNTIERTLHFKNDKIRVEYKIENIEVQVKIAVYLGLILNELLTNAIKYAFPGDTEGKIMIQLYNQNNIITCIIADNGVGFPEHLDFRNSESLGLTLINSLVQQLEGNVALERSSGTKFIITLKAA